MNSIYRMIKHLTLEISPERGVPDPAEKNGNRATRGIRDGTREKQRGQGTVKGVGWPG